MTVHIYPLTIKVKMELNKLVYYKQITEFCRGQSASAYYTHVYTAQNIEKYKCTGCQHQPVAKSCHDLHILSNKLSKILYENTEYSNIFELSS